LNVSLPLGCCATTGVSFPLSIGSGREIVADTGRLVDFGVARQHLEFNTTSTTAAKLGEEVAFGVQLTDSYGNPIEGVAVTISCHPAGLDFGEVESQTDANGQVTFSALAMAASDYSIIVETLSGANATWTLSVHGPESEKIHLDSKTIAGFAAGMIVAVGVAATVGYMLGKRRRKKPPA